MSLQHSSCPLKEDLKENFHNIMSTVKDIPFVLHCVTTGFNPTTAFSSSSFHLAAHTDERRTCRLGVTVSNLFEVDLKPEHAEALTFIMNSSRQSWPPDSSRAKSEQQVVLELASQILVPLSRRNDVVLEQKYCHIPRPDGLRCAYLGMGSLKTWHGTPDVRVRGAQVVCRCIEASEGEDLDAPHSPDSTSEDPYDSNGATTNIEGKIVYSVAHLPQLVTTGVVASFTERNLYPDQKGFIPTILMDHNQFRVCLYDCASDVLTISDSVQLAAKGRLSTSGMAFLWVVINHRYVHYMIMLWLAHLDCSLCSIIQRGL